MGILLNGLNFLHIVSAFCLELIDAVFVFVARLIFVDETAENASYTMKGGRIRRIVTLAVQEFENQLMSGRL